ncbi:MAG: hypothetical protein QOK02_3084 [Mycobacterium sp.]|nr:hypothetical protein [Mycobacterium sp.]
MVPRIRLAAAACLMASGLLVAGTGASLALADPESGKPADTGGSPNNSAQPATGDPEATGTSGAAVPGSAPGATGGPSKPSSQVGDGRNGVPAGGTTGSATTHESTHESASPTETAPTTVTETSSKPTETETTHAPQTESASPSEQASGVTTHVSVDPQVPLADLPQALVAAAESEAAAADVVVSTETTTTTAAPVWWPFNWWNWAVPQVVTPDGGGSGNGIPNQVTWQSPIPPGMQLPVPQLPTIPSDLLAPINGFSFDPFVDAVNGVLTGVNNVVTGLATAASQLPFAQVTLPVVVFPGGPVVAVPNGNGGSVGAGSPGLAPRPGIPAAPSHPGNPGAGSPPQAPSEPAQKKQSPPAFSASNQASVAPSYRMGYMEYLRAAGLGEVAAVAVPGFTGILILTGAGGLIGYRQARAGSTMRTGNTARFMG